MPRPTRPSRAARIASSLSPAWLRRVSLVCVAVCGLVTPYDDPAATAADGPEDREPTRAELYDLLHQQAALMEAQSAVVKTVAKLVSPTVVHIEADLKLPSGRRIQKLEEAGSGVIVQINGGYYVLTNRHVIRGAEPKDIRVKLADNRVLHPGRVWEDPKTDVAVMSVSGANLVAADVGDSDRAETGDFVLAVGSPFGLSHSVTFGIVSAKGRRDLQLGDTNVLFQDFLQTDAAINPGNSGGPLINLRGQVIGINTAIASNSGRNEGIGFSIPINMVMFAGRQLIEHGVVQRAFLGVNLDRDFGPAAALRVGLPYPHGARITGFTKGAPSESANLKVGDVILKFNGTEVADDGHLVNLVGLTEVGTKVSLVVLRDGQQITVKVEVGDRAKFTVPE